MISTKATTTYAARIEALREHHIPNARRRIADQMRPIRSTPRAGMVTHIRSQRDAWITTLGGLYSTIGQDFANHTLPSLATQTGVADPTANTGYDAAYSAFIASYTNEQTPPYVDQVFDSFESQLDSIPDGMFDDMIDDLFGGVELVVGTMAVLLASNLGPMASANALDVTEELDLIKRWQAIEDDRTRPSHADADGQEQSLADPFDVGESQLMFPCDASLGADVGEIIYCRCVVVYDLPGSKRRMLRLDWPERLAETVLTQMGRH